mmetsp:Transcript_33757/g.77142  ORF Transcript_33757/g.77142 Transcript_33757/m.77142 type:complete len:385 (-) Transcript_33757:2527-3681(-)
MRRNPRPGLQRDEERAGRVRAGWRLCRRDAGEHADGRVARGRGRAAVQVRRFPREGLRLVCQAGGDYRGGDLRLHLLHVFDLFALPLVRLDADYATGYEPPDRRGVERRRRALNLLLHPHRCYDRRRDRAGGRGADQGARGCLPHHRHHRSRGAQSSRPVQRRRRDPREHLRANRDRERVLHLSDPPRLPGFHGAVYLRPGWEDGGACGQLRIGQVDGRGALAALLPPYGGADHARWPRHLDLEPQVVPLADRDRLAGARALLVLDQGEHPPRERKGDRSGNRRGGKSGQRLQLCHAAPGGVRHGGDQRPAVRRPEATGRDCARGGEEPEDPAPGRGDLRARRQVRSGGPGCPREVHAGADDTHHRAPPLDRAQRRSHPRPQPG